MPLTSCGARWCFRPTAKPKIRASNSTGKGAAPKARPKIVASTKSRTSEANVSKPPVAGQSVVALRWGLQPKAKAGVKGKRKVSSTRSPGPSPSHKEKADGDKDEDDMVGLATETQLQHLARHKGKGHRCPRCRCKVFCRVILN